MEHKIKSANRIHLRKQKSHRKILHKQQKKELRFPFNLCRSRHTLKKKTRKRISKVKTSKVKIAESFGRDIIKKTFDHSKRHYQNTQFVFPKNFRFLRNVGGITKVFAIGLFIRKTVFPLEGCLEIFWSLYFRKIIAFEKRASFLSKVFFCLTMLKQSSGKL